MLDDLDKTVRALLVAAGFAADQIGFNAPDGAGTADTAPAINLFLYDVRENRELRSVEWVATRQGATVTKQRAPVRVDCSYLITATAGDPLSEHLLLGRVMAALLRYATVPAALLQGSLAGQALPTSALQPSHVQGIGDVWQTMGSRPRAVLHYTVTISVDPYEPVTAPAVVEHSTTLRLAHAGEAHDA